MADEQTAGAIALATDLAIAWLGNPHTRASADDVNAFISAVHQKLGSFGSATAADEPPQENVEYAPAVSARKSLADPEVIVSMIDGKPYRALKRHLSANGLTPAAYRERYGLKPDYPMVAPAYSEARRATAKRVGLGRKKDEPVPVEEADAAEKPQRRRSVASAKAAAQQHLKG